MESAVAWQGVTFIERTPEQVENIRCGGYTLRDCDGTPDALLIATGSEVGLALEAADRLGQSHYEVRVVSMPSTDAFERQSAEYRDSVLPDGVRNRVAVEAGAMDGWRKYVGLGGDVIGIDSFGASAPSDELYAHFGITLDRIVEAVEKVFTREDEIFPAAVAN